jgi:hypothetical protein
VTIKNLSKTKNLEFLPVYVSDTGDEEPENVVDLKCGGEVCMCVRERARGGEGGREGGNGGREGGKEGGRRTGRDRQAGMSSDAHANAHAHTHTHTHTHTPIHRRFLLVRSTSFPTRCRRMLGRRKMRGRSRTATGRTVLKLRFTVPKL